MLTKEEKQKARDIHKRFIANLAKWKIVANLINCTEEIKLLDWIEGITHVLSDKAWLDMEDVTVQDVVQWMGYRKLVKCRKTRRCKNS